MPSYDRVNYRRTREAGLCTKCSKPAPPGQARCLRCKNTYKRYFTKRQEAGKCADCPNPIDFARSTRLCSNCLDKSIAKRTRNKDVVNEQTYHKRKAREAAGLCVMCAGKHGDPVPGKKSCQHCIDTHKAKNYALTKRLLVFEKYGGCHCACPGCFVTDHEFLTIDHIHNDGAAHRKQFKIDNIYNWLIKNNYPPGFQVLCMNCNFVKGKRGRNGQCIHVYKDRFFPEYCI